MKLAFSTLGCPEWTFDEVLQYGEQYGFQGVSFRGIHGEMDLRKIPQFAEAERPATIRRLADAGLEPAMMMASARFALADPGERQKHLDEARAAIDLAAAMGAPAIRVFGGAIPEGVEPEAAYGWVAENLPIYALNILITTATDLWALRYPDSHQLYVLDRSTVHPDGSSAELRSRRIRTRSERLSEIPSVVFASEPMDGESGWRLMDSGELIHVDADLRLTSGIAFPDPPAQLLRPGGSPDPV